MSDWNIYQRLSAVTTELSAVAKNLMVGEGKSSYKAVGEADVLAAVKPLEAKYGIYSYPFSRDVIDSDVIVKKKVYSGKEFETSSFFMRVKTVYRFVNMDKPDEYIDVTTYGDGVDANDKAPGKAMTYGDKYALLKAYKIITGDDTDQTISDDGKVQRASGPVCESCGLPIQPYNDGRDTIHPAALAKRSKERYGKVLCVKCAKAAQKQ